MLLKFEKNMDINVEWSKFGFICVTKFYYNIGDRNLMQFHIIEIFIKSNISLAK